MAGTVIKRRLKRVADFFIFDVPSRPRGFRFPVNGYIKCIVILDVGVNVKIATQGKVRQWTWSQ